MSTHLDFEPDSGTRWTFQFRDTSIRCDGPPWSKSDPDTVKIPEFVLLRSARYMTATTLPPFDPAKTARLMAWGVVKMAELGVLSDDVLFRHSSRGVPVTLRPEPRSSVPLQWVHFGRGTLTNSLADTLCSALTVAQLLERLNMIMETEHSLDEPGLSICLEHFLASSRDFGQVYGCLRRRWKSNFQELLPQLAKRKQADEALRYNAVDRSGSYIKDSAVPPRRVWDLYSNRVIPFHALLDSLPDYIPDNVWTVSHSWVAESSRTFVWTPINGDEWPVPIPCDTTLEHLRVELLNLGAEYIWLDVLCLRQRGRDEDEPLRKDEWGLDVPTIGHVYSNPYRICVTYFNGLGLPFDPSPSILQSDRHWLNRVWTVQEGTAAWLPGGLTGLTSPEATQFFQAHHSRALPRRERMTISYFLDFAIQTLRSRFCTTELDRISGLAYMLRCPTLPVYDEGVTTALAWTILSKHLLPHLRTSVALWYVYLNPSLAAVWPSWEQLLGGDASAQIRDSYHAILPEDPLNFHVLEVTPVMYYHTVDAVGPCIIAGIDEDEPSGDKRLSIRRTGSDVLAADAVVEATCCVEGTIRPGVTYTLLRFQGTTWLVVEVTGTRDIGGTEAFVVKRRAGLLRGRLGEILASAPRIPVTVVYLAEELVPVK